MHKKLLTCLFFAIFTHATVATAAAQVVITEVYPAPPTGESEWVELYNAGETAVSLAGWKLQDQLTIPSDFYIFTTEQLAPHSFFVAQLSAAKLNNTADGVTLYKADSSVGAVMSYTSSQSGMSWQLTSLLGSSYVLTSPSKGTDSPIYTISTPMPTPTVAPSPGIEPTTTPTPAPQVSIPTAEPSPTPTTMLTTTPAPLPSPTPTPSVSTSPTPTPSPSPLPTATPTVTPNASLLQLSEFMACPSSGSEWLELFNSSSTAIEINNWKVSDASGNSRYLMGNIPAKSWQVFSWTSSFLNNTGDELVLTTPNNEVLSQTEYESCTTGMSYIYAIVDNVGKWVQTTPSPGKENIYLATNVATTTTDSSSISPKITPTLALHQLTDSESKTKILGHSTALQRTQLPFAMPNLVFKPSITSHASGSARFVDHVGAPSRQLSSNAILSSTIALCSSCALLYGKKIIAIITSLG